jgi:hypothetical protein
MVEWLPLLFRILQVCGSNLDWRPTILTEVFHGFFYSFQANARIEAMTAFFHVFPNSSIIVSFDTLVWATDRTFLKLVETTRRLWNDGHVI